MVEIKEVDLPHLLRGMPLERKRRERGGTLEEGGRRIERRDGGAGEILISKAKQEGPQRIDRRNLRLKKITSYLNGF